jgi:hypothetical protein
MKIQVVKKGSTKVKESSCPWVVDVPPDAKQK